MFREMRRNRQQLSHEESVKILNKCSSGVLALSGDDGYPYAVPMSYIYADGKIYFHSAKSGHKIDSVNREEKASFCVIDADDVVPEEYTTYFRSVIAFGRIHILTDETEKRRTIELLAKKYYPGDTDEHRDMAIEKEYPPVCMLEMNIEHMTGKEAIELVSKIII